jgi:hypothetical protein
MSIEAYQQNHSVLPPMLWTGATTSLLETHQIKNDIAQLTITPTLVVETSLGIEEIKELSVGLASPQIQITDLEV